MKRVAFRYPGHLCLLALLCFHERKTVLSKYVSSEVLSSGLLSVENSCVFKTLGISSSPVMLAPLAGVSDYPFRSVCEENGADLTYVEMLSATALCYGSEKTFDMLFRHESEKKVGVQITSKSVDEMARSTEIVNKYPFETIDINMGCPVKKVVKAGCGSAILRDPERVYETTEAAVQNSDKPVSVKIRLGWTPGELTYLEVADAAESAGASWLTVHGRTRSDDYSAPVDLERIAELKRRLSIPVIGNGNVFSFEDAEHMKRVTGVDGVMVSRGALGNPWVFREIKTGNKRVDLGEWAQLVDRHLKRQIETYADQPFSAVCMRKHLLWYLKGWPGVKAVKDEVTRSESNTEARKVIERYYNDLRQKGLTTRAYVSLSTEQGGRFVWDPKWEMDRRLDRGVGDDHLVSI